MTEALHVGRPNIGNRKRLMMRLNDILDSRWLSNGGVFVQRLEETVAELVGVRHCIAVCNGTVGLQVALKAAGVTGQVIVPAWTHIATAHALTWIGLEPVFADVNEQHVLGKRGIQYAISSCTGAILGVHLWGRPCSIEALEHKARCHDMGFPLIFDAAHAFGCSHRGQMIGGFGDAEVFSFHATKFVNGFEGGAICTNDDALAERARAMINFGYRDGEVRHVGTNAKMSEVSAAMVLTSIESMGEFVAVNHRNYAEYRKQLPGVTFVEYDESEQQNYQYVVIEIPDRDRVMEALHAEKVMARRYFWPGIHRMAPYRWPAATLPETERLAACTLALPTGTAIGVSEITRVCDIIKRVMEESTMHSMPAWAAS